MSFEDRYVTPTPEGVSLDVVLAGLGSRFSAFLVDFILQIIAYVIVLLAVFFAVSGNGETSTLVESGTLIAVGGLIFFGYFIVCEMLWSGRSIGKRAAGIRVVNRNGLPVGFLTSLLRNIARLIDILPIIPAPYLVGSVAILASPNNQRLGDMLAGTIVIRERHAADRIRRDSSHHNLDSWSRASTVGGPLTANGLPPELASWDVSAVSDDEAALVRQFLSRRWEYAPAARERLATTLADRLRPRVAGNTTVTEPERFLEAVARVKRDRR